MALLLDSMQPGTHTTAMSFSPANVSIKEALVDARRPKTIGFNCPSSRSNPPSLGGQMAANLVKSALRSTGRHALPYLPAWMLQRLHGDSEGQNTPLR